MFQFLRDVLPQNNIFDPKFFTTNLEEDKEDVGMFQLKPMTSQHFMKQDWTITFSVTL
jgi:hypothetical protein